LGEGDARDASGLVFLRADHGQLAVVFLGNIVGVLFLLLSFFSGLALSCLLSLLSSCQ
jgi:hypothetical protein